MALVINVTTTSSPQTVTIPISGSVNVDIAWGDTQTDEGVTSSNPSHEFATADDYEITVTGSANELNNIYNQSGWGACLRGISDWSGMGLTGLDYCFRWVSNDVSLPATLPSSVISLKYMFQNSTGVVSALDLTGWDVSSVTGDGFIYMFADCDMASLDLSGWDVSGATDLKNMFQNCSSVTSIDVTGWNVSNVTNFSNMFNTCASLTEIPGIGDWNVSSAETFSSSFASCDALPTLDLSGWDTGGVTNLYHMFYSCNIFDADFSQWDVSGVTDFGLFIFRCDISLVNYSKLLIGWSQLTLQSGVTADFRNNNGYAQGAPATARASIESTYSWDFYDEGESGSIEWADPAQSTASVPADGEVGVATNITVQGKDSGGDNCSIGGSVIVVSVTGANAATPAVTDNEDGTYSCSYTPTVGGTDSIAITLDGTALTASPYSSDIPLPAPDSPTLSAPADDSSTTDQTPAFTWSEPDGAETYQIQIDESGGGFSDPLVDDDTLVSAAYTADTLDAGDYDWRVRAANSQDAWGDWSAAFTVTINPAPDAPSLLTPADAAETEATPSFTWSEPDRATGYQIQIGTVANFATTVVDDDTLAVATYTPAALDVGTYYWRVRAKNSVDEWGDWSLVSTVTITADPAQSPAAAARPGGVGVGIGVGV